LFPRIIFSFSIYKQQAAESIAESVLSVARAEAVVAVTGEGGANSTSELSVVLHPRPDTTGTVTSDLATIVESLALNTDCSVNSTSNRASSSKSLFATVRGNKVNHYVIRLRYIFLSLF
jgi:E3 ubiquitin-protein ligase HECTD1